MNPLRALLYCFFVFLTFVASVQRSGAQTTSPPATTSARPVEDLGVLSGTVTDADGAVVQGAHVTLTNHITGLERSAVTGPDGHFRFSNVPAGAFKVAATASGLESASTEAVIQPGELLEVPTIALRVATANTDVMVTLTREEIAEEDLHVEEKQRLAGFVPNFYVTYDWKAPPLTPKQKFKLAGRSIVDPASFIITGGIAGLQQAANGFAGYHQGATGYAKRYGAGFADLSIGTVLGGAVLPIVFKQDPRYFYKGTGSNRSRALYALSTAVIARGDNGRWQPAYAAILGDFGAGAISNLYYPPGNRSGGSTTIENGLIGIAGNGLGNLVQEFFFKKITPSSRKSGPSNP